MKTWKYFVLIISIVVIFCIFALENKKEVKIEEIIEKIEIPEKSTKFIYFVTQHDKKMKGKRQIKFGRGFFKQSKFLILSLKKIIIQV